MLTTEEKQGALRALLQRLSFSNRMPGGERHLEPVNGNCLAPALFAEGLHEIIGETPGDRAAAIVFALIAANHRKEGRRALFFASLAGEGREGGLLYGAGLARLGLNPTRLCLLVAPSEKTLLWAAEEAASCRALASAVIALGRHEKLYGFTESRRLKLRLEKSGVPLFIVRARAGDASAATARWHVAFAASEGLRTPGSPVPLLGRPRFCVRLDRYAGVPLQWEIELDEAYALRVVAAVSDRPADTRPLPNERAA